MFVCDVKSGVEISIGERRLSCGTKLMVVSFCGSESLADWACNITMFLTHAVEDVGLGRSEHMRTVRVREAQGRVHAGFMWRWRCMRYKVLRTLHGLSPGRILVTGHSMGGALASLSAHEIADALPSADVSVITFGAPMAADAVFNGHDRPTNLVESVRCVHAGDFVQRLPPLPSYTHDSSAELVLVGTNANAARRFIGMDDSQHTWAPWLPVSLIQQLQRAWRGRFGIAAHEVFAYRRAINTGDIQCTKSMVQ